MQTSPDRSSLAALLIEGQLAGAVCHDPSWQLQRARGRNQPALRDQPFTRVSRRIRGNKQGNEMPPLGHLDRLT